MVEYELAHEPVSVLNYSPVFEKFTKANEALLNCYQAQDMESYKVMGAAARVQVCQAEKNTLKGILSSNDMTMTQVVTDRVKVLYALNRIGVTHEFINETRWDGQALFSI